MYISIAHGQVTGMLQENFGTRSNGRDWMAEQLGLITATSIEMVYETSVLEF